MTATACSATASTMPVQKRSSARAEPGRTVAYARGRPRREAIRAAGSSPTHSTLLRSAASRSRRSRKLLATPSGYRAGSAPAAFVALTASRHGRELVRASHGAPAAAPRAAAPAAAPRRRVRARRRPAPCRRRAPRPARGPRRRDRAAAPRRTAPPAATGPRREARALPRDRARARSPARRRPARAPDRRRAAARRLATSAPRTTANAHHVARVEIGGEQDARAPARPPDARHLRVGRAQRVDEAGRTPRILEALLRDQARHAFAQRRLERGLLARQPRSQRTRRAGVRERIVRAVAGRETAPGRSPQAAAVIHGHPRAAGAQAVAVAQRFGGLRRAPARCERPRVDGAVVAHGLAHAQRRGVLGEPQAQVDRPVRSLVAHVAGRAPAADQVELDERGLELGSRAAPSRSAPSAARAPSIRGGWRRGPKYERTRVRRSPALPT